jgi:hypothetical protein
MKIYSKQGVELHKHTNQSGTVYKLYVHNKYYPFPKLTTAPNSNSEFSNKDTRAFIKEKDDGIVRVKYVCQVCGHTSMEAEALKACMVICTDCKGIMLPPVKVKKLQTIKKLVRRKGMERF